MGKIYHHCFYENVDGANKVIVTGEQCLTRTSKCFWEDPNDIEHRVKTRSPAQSEANW